VSDEEFLSLKLSAAIGVSYIADGTPDSPDDAATFSQLIATQPAYANSSDADTWGILLNAIPGELAFSIGADATNTYMQTWWMKPLIVNKEGNNVVIGDTTTHNGVLVVPELQYPEFTPSVSVKERTLHDTSGGTALNWEARTLRDPTGKESMDWEARELRDNNEALSIHYKNRALVDADGDPRVYWNTGQLVNSDGTSVHWKSRFLQDEFARNAQSWSVAGQSGATRPTGPFTLAPGYMFFDTTLGKPIWWDGTDWVDATGAVV
jgi:hypothetical protein